MAWDFAAGEEAEALLADALGKTRSYLMEGKPRRAAEAWRQGHDALCALIEQRDGLLAPEPAKPAPRAPEPQLQLRTGMASAQCVRGVHAWGPINNLGFATCQSCGSVTITPRTGDEGPYDMGAR